MPAEASRRSPTPWILLRLPSGHQGRGGDGAGDEHSLHGLCHGCDECFPTLLYENASQHDGVSSASFSAKTAISLPFCVGSPWPPVRPVSQSVFRATLWMPVNDNEMLIHVLKNWRGLRVFGDRHPQSSLDT